MRQLGLILTGLGLVACSRPNPFYGASGTEGAEGSVGSPSGGPTTTAGDTSPTSADGSQSGGTTVDPSTGPSDTDAPENRCELYAINAGGELYVIDVDEPAALRVAGPSSSYASRALATHPISGTLHYTLVGNSESVMTVDPIGFDVDPGPIPFPGIGWGAFERATFEGGALWLGTSDTGRFGMFFPGDPVLEDFQVAMAGGGGDMIGLPGDTALVLTETGLALIIDFNFVDAVPIPINGLQGDALFTGLARDDEGRLWASTAGAESDLVEFTLEQGPAGPSVVGVIQRVKLDISIDDLAPIVVHSDAC